MDNIERLHELGASLNASFTLDDADSHIRIGHLSKKDKDAYVYYPMYKNAYFAYQLNTAFAPTGIYTDIKVDSTDNRQRRNDEILETVQLYFQDKLPLKTKRGLFGRKKSYLALKVDGKEQQYFVRNRE